ncbi:hypothetical protein J2T09_005559 [Neorhizobium huautlense]|uniref:Uncharacterized protein n=1 Tax=Neorhizobium huautlense TaxID=67774 RepID=A0ABT9Q313_9HYPH|nr:hypothetical protein [Neorhizobium huautlense]MDP9840771.1 hypothetical protein [Neorhizobium huautlense]
MMQLRETPIEQICWRQPYDPRTGPLISKRLVWAGRIATRPLEQNRHPLKLGHPITDKPHDSYIFAIPTLLECGTDKRAVIADRLHRQDLQLGDGRKVSRLDRWANRKERESG